MNIKEYVIIHVFKVSQCYIMKKKICFDEVPENYYLNSSDEIYRECFYKCRKCHDQGNESDNNCDICMNDYRFNDDSLLKEKNCYGKCEFYYYLNESKHYFCTQFNSCPENFKLITEKGKCIDECYNDDLYKFEFENICYEQCPIGTINNENNKTCTTIPTTLPTKEKEEYSFKNHTTEEIYEKVKNEIIKTFQKDDEEIVINTTNNYIFQVTSTTKELDILNGNKNNTNKLSVIDLRNCNDILIDVYNLTNDSHLIVLKYENLANDVNEKSIQYEVYEPISFQKLNLSFCSSVSIDIYIPVEVSEGTLQLYDDLKSQGYNLFDKNDKFYTDICTPYESQNGTDILLSDRYNDIYKPNELSCQQNCEYSDYNMESEYLKCECNIVEQEQIEIEEPEKLTAKLIANSFVNVLKYSNYRVLKCIKLVLSKTTFYKNIGSILSIAYFLGYLISFVFFCFKKITNLKVEIKK